MKKIAFSIMLLSFVSFGLAQCKDSAAETKDISQGSLDALTSKVSELEGLLKKAEDEKAENPTKKISEKLYYQILEKVKNISHFLFEQLKFVADKSDKIISKKFFIAAILIAAPAVSLYCKFFTPNLLSKITQYFSSELTQGAATLTKDVMTGVAKGTKEVVDKEVIKEVLKEVADNSVDIAVDLAKDAVKSPKVWGVGAAALGIYGSAKYALGFMGQLFRQTQESFAKEIAEKISVKDIYNVVPKNPTDILVGAATVVTAVTAPQMLFVTVPAFLLHRYYHHDQMLPSLEDLGLNYIFGN